jgi:hypothetical protein
MNLPEPYNTDEVDHLMINAQLRDELEPLYDEAIGRVNPQVMTTRSENEFLASMLEWERAPMLPICRWFEPELVIPVPDRISQDQMSAVLISTIDKLFQKHIVLDFTEHLSDYDLYCLIYRDILPAYEKKLDRRDTYLHWDCANTSDDPETWLRYYANDEDREIWAAENEEEDIPPHEDPPYPRRLPRVPL